MKQFNMIDSPQGPDPKRLMLAVVVTSAVLMVYSYFFAPTPSQETPKEAPVAAPIETTAAKSPDRVFHAQATASDVATTFTSFSVQESSKKDLARASYRAQTSSCGALISEYALTDFSHEMPLWDQKATGSSLLRLFSKNALITLDSEAPYEVMSEDKDHIAFRHVTKEGLEIKRRYQFLDDARIDEKISFKNLSETPLKVELALSAVKNGQKGTEPGLMNPGVQGEALVVKTASDHERLSYSDVQEKPRSFNDIKYIAFDDQFFLSAILPRDQAALERLDMRVASLPNNAHEATIELILKPFVLVFNEDKTISHQLFMGPKQVNLLASINPPLDENIDFGWFGILSRPMLWLLVQIYNFGA